MNNKILKNRKNTLKSILAELSHRKLTKTINLHEIGEISAKIAEIDYLLTKYPDTNDKVAVCIIYDSSSDSILLLERKKSPFGFGLPGGKVENTENDVEACIRETSEETSINIKNPIYLGKSNSIKNNYEMLVFCKILNTKPDVKLTNEHLSYVWTNRKDINAMLAGNTIEMINLFNTYYENNFEA